MLGLAIPVDFDAAGNTIVELNSGAELKAERFPQDCEFQLVAFRPSGKKCEVVWTEELAEDIAEALVEIDRITPRDRAKLDWYRRLALYASGVKR